MIRVLVADDHPIVRTGIVGLLDTEPDFEVVAEASSGEDAVALAAEVGPDIVLMDLRMPGFGGVEATRRIAAVDSPPRVLVFTTYEDDDRILAAIEAGAAGYLLKAAPAEELIVGVRAVIGGQTVLAPSVAARLAAASRASRGEGAVADAPPILTARETEIIALVADGLSNPEIAKRLFIGESTVKTHLLHVFEKLGVSDRTRAAMRALELGLLP